MKDSEIGWIGAIPETWGTGKIGHLYSERKEKVSDCDYAPLSVTMKGIVPQLSTAAKSDAHDDRKLVLKGDFAINSRSDRRGSCGISDYDGSVSLINTILTPRSSMNPNYYDWLFHTTMFADEFYKWGHGIVDDLWTTNWSDMKKIAVPTPDLKEQQAIADFINLQCSHIDNTLVKTQTSIEEYKKLRQAFITQAVTQGIHGDRPLKDSGIEWIGNIPEDWSVQRVKNVAQIFGRIGFRGYTIDDLVSVGEGAITLSPSNIRNLRLNYDNCTYISWEKYDESPEIQIETGDVLFVKTGSSYGKSGIVTDLPLQATINPQLVVFKKITIDNRYFMYALQMPSVRNEIESVVSGGTIPTMGQEKIRNFHICVPPIEEQIEIAEYLDNKCSEIDRIISKKESLLTELESYKRSLIYEYVTGKKEV